MRTGYKCRAYPNVEQASVLNRTFGCIRVVWNRTLAWRHARYYDEQARTNFTQANAYLSFAVDVADPVQLPAAGAVVGVGAGIKHFAVTSDGEKIPNSGRLARAHRKVRASRQDFLHRTPARLVRDHDVLVIEDLAVKNMARNRSLARVISDCGWGTFRAMLEYKAAKADGRHSGSSRVRSAAKQEPRPVTAGIPVLQGGE